jgi:RNA polymerase sigma-70 factor (ECF subfamily)
MPLPDAALEDRPAAQRPLSLGRTQVASLEKRHSGLNDQRANAASRRADHVEPCVAARAKAGDREAMSQLYVEHVGRVYAYFLARLHGRTQLAEDLTSEVFVRALDGIAKYQCRGLPFAAWLFRIARNLLIDHTRSQPRDPFIVLEDCADLPSLGGQRALDLVAERQDLLRPWRRLTREQAEVVRLRFIHGQSIFETAATTGKTVEAVKKLQARGLGVLRNALLGSATATSA